MRNKTLSVVVLGLVLISNVAFALTMTQAEFDAKYKGTGTTPSGGNAFGSTGVYVPPAPVSSVPTPAPSSNATSIFNPGSEPDGFRGIEWGADIKTLPGTEYLGTDTSFGGVQAYRQKNDELKIGAADLEKIEYSFWKGKFFGVTIYIKGAANWAGLKEATFMEFGAGYQKDKDVEEYAWLGETTAMMLRYTSISGEGMLSMISTEFSKQQAEYDSPKAKEGAGKGY